MRKKSAGFTLIELLISIAVLAVLSVSVFAAYSGMSARFELKTEAFRVLDVLNLARSRTVGALELSSWGVHLETTQYVLFKGTTYSMGDPDNVAYALPASVEISNIALAGGAADVVFDRLTGKTTQSGTFRLRLVSDNSKYKTIEMLASGRSDIPEGTLPPAGTRISDTRHVHFTYNQNIGWIGTLTLDFPGYLTQDIDFPTYYSGGVFDWSGTINVGGSPQVLRIHTHATSGSSADFSITRDARYNDKELYIYFDYDNINYIAHYPLVGDPTENSIWISGIVPQ